MCEHNWISRTAKRAEKQITKETLEREDEMGWTQSVMVIIKEETLPKRAKTKKSRMLKKT